MTINQHYVYRLTHPKTKEFYIGCRTTFYGSVKRDYYMGSGKWPRNMKSAGIKLTKEIVKIFDDLAPARTLEAKLIYQNRDNKLCRNVFHPIERNLEILTLFKGNVAIADIARQHNLSWPRTERIIKQELARAASS